MIRYSWAHHVTWTRSLAAGVFLAIWVLWGWGGLGPAFSAIAPSASGLAADPTTDATDATDAAAAAAAAAAPGHSSSNFYPPPSSDPRLRPLVLYAYFESENARRNLDFFVRTGLHRNADFIFIFNGETSAPEMIPALPNVQVIVRKNECYDIGAFGEVLQKDGLWRKYKRFILMNASVRGPFFPIHSQACWTDKFLGRLSDKVKLVGISINCNPKIHVQSFLLATDDVGMAVLLNPDLAYTADDDGWGTHEQPIGLTPCFPTMDSAIHSEIQMTALLQSQGYGADVMLTATHTERSFGELCERVGWAADFFNQLSYFGTNVHPYETIFMKANRDIDPTQLDRLTEWHLRANLSSWDVCGGP